MHKTKMPRYRTTFAFQTPASVQQFDLLTTIEKSRVMRTLTVIAAILIILFSGGEGLAQTTFEHAQTLYDQKHVAESRIILGRLCGKPNAKPQELCLFADTFLQDETSDESLQMVDGLAKRALSSDPQWGNAWKILAQTENAREHYRQAISLCNKALSVAKPDRRALLQRCLAYQAVGNVKLALADITEYSEKDDRSAEMLILRAGLLNQTHQPAEAVKLYEIAYKMRPVDWTIYRIADCYAQQKKYNQAERAMTTLIKVNPNDGEAFYFRAEYILHQNRFNEALADISKAILLEPNGKFYRARAAILNDAGRKLDAQLDLRRAEEADSKPF